ncbi:MAG: periplasmic sensor diguanylate [Beijerinckiaceae bacterium]|nr:MAG: periplasmic sensor diguanylate [Beijerinckiaceae bacterium]
MHGRTLVRTLDAGIIAIVTIAVILLGVLAWTTRSMDISAFETETTIVHHQISRLVGEFRTDAQLAATSDEVWLARRPQGHAIIAPATASAGQGNLRVLAREASRIGQLLSDAPTRQRLVQALTALRKLDDRRQRVDFALIGPAGDENLALIAQQLMQDGSSGLLVMLLDFPKLASELEAFSVKLLPVTPVGQATMSQDGHLLLSGYSGETIASLDWQGRRFSDSVEIYVMPVMTVILGIGFVILMILRHHWAEVRDGFAHEYKKIEAAAYTDSLTGLPNRRALFERLMAVASMDQEMDPITVLMLDIDGLKWVNDNLGHSMGDRVLVWAAQVFTDELGEEAYVARLGGDEFAAILPGTVVDDDLQVLYQRLAQALRKQMGQGGVMHVGVSVGAAASSQMIGDGEYLLQQADIAVYAAKAAGRGMALTYSPGMKQGKSYRKTLERELRAALLTGGFFLVHQPIVDALHGTVLGYESLIRWRHTSRGVLGPAEFIPIAEQSHIIVAIGNHVLDLALRELGPLGNCRISVNATGRQLLSQGFVEHVGELLARHEVDASRLCLELTETSLIEDGEGIARVMTDLRALGVKMAIDDFGVGYSSLSHLLRYKFDVLKIDRDFVVNLDDKPEAPMIVTAVVTLARSLGMQVVGEGIETPAQHRFLASAGCNALQGYLFGRPVPVFNLGPELNLGSDAKPTTTDTRTRFQAA